ncbi:MAG: hypothetical protein Q8O01_02785 [Candidatus Omnitrophota bacterium]|nr:hypothetical protein [Candidatus Omnitrophota bacterium]
MSEENKDLQSSSNQAEKPVEAPKVETPKVEAPKVHAPAGEAPKAEAVKTEEPKEAAPKQEEKKKEKPVNCAVCNKSIKKKRYYYRNGKYFCTKRCFKTTVKKENAAPEEKAA